MIAVIPLTGKHVIRTQEMTASLSILSGLTAEDVTEAPYAHIVRTDRLDTALFAELSATMPRPAFGPDVPQNFLAQLDPFDPSIDAVLKPVWREFAAYHASPAFWSDVVRVFGPAMRRTHPGIEQRIGHPLEAARAAGATGPDAGASDVRMGFQLSYNTPVLKPSSVRGPHIDKTRRMLSALLYMPEPGDEDGGELVIYRWKSQRRFAWVNADPDDLVEVARVAYAPNTLVMFVNSVDSVHGVTARRPTGRVRRYVNLFADLATEFVDLSPFQVATTDA